MSLDPHGNVHTVESDEEFETLILTAEETPVIVDFYADWCGPCKQIAPLFTELSVKHSNAIFLRTSAEKHGVRAMPTFLVFLRGQKAQEMKGANPEGLRSFIQQATSGQIITEPSNKSESITPTQPTPTPSTTPSAAPSIQPTPSAKPAHSFKYFPNNSYTYFETGKTDQIVDKLIELNNKYNGTQDNRSLSESEKKILKEISTVLKNTSQYHVSKITRTQVNVFSKMLLWQPEDRFPALDLLRLLILHPDASQLFAEQGHLDLLSLLHQKELPWQSHTMVLRFVCNSFKFTSLRQSVTSQLDSILVAIDSLKSHEKEQVRLPAVTVLFNFSIYFHQEKGQASQKKKVIERLLNKLSAEKDEETQLRTVVSLGELLSDPSDSTFLCAEVWKDKALASNLASFAPATPKVTEALKELQLIFTGTLPRKPEEKKAAPVQTETPSAFPSMPNIPGIGANPRLMQALQNPSTMAKLQQMMSNPMAISQFRDDPEIGQLIELINSMMLNR
ncbi:phospholipase A-2-activating protein [Planoprotostelium fungivorum]|uniref:Phospholipase A-2-activating protein n=1 Tax=Planoprotostelium fungivorum TaxID=1890364 RepID=A0A2P6N8X6_9EUKA|nr:phospholipase A-2-activating protein [Planoprotostelium fungivorum]